jgi:hopene-associated glycosyltransferase HpnB
LQRSSCSKLLPFLTEYSRAETEEFRFAQRLPHCRSGIMGAMVLLISTLALAAWVYLLALHGWFWRSRPVLERGVPERNATVVVVVPARNEASHIRESIGSLVAQKYPGPLHVVLVDDNSTDQTGEIAAAIESGGRLSIIKGAGLPLGWSGKMWAVHQGLAQESVRTADYVLLTDADVVHAPDHVAALVGKAERDGLDLVSEMVRLNCATAAERILIPAFIFFFQMLYPFAWVNDSRKRTAGAAGGTMLLRRTALERVEGVSRIRRKLIDDCALAREVKQSGGKIWLVHSELARSTRVYAKASEVWNMIARTAYEQLGHSLLMLAACVLGMSLLYFAPVGMAIAAHGTARWCGIATWLLTAFCFQPTLRRYQRSPLWGMALPGIAAFYLCATVDSALRFYQGRGGGWKERVYSEG